MAEADPQIEQPQEDAAAQSTGAQHRRRRVPWPVRIVMGIVALIFAAWLFLYITKGRFLRHPFENVVSRQIGREVRVGGDFQLYLDWFNIKFVADDLRVSNPAWRGGQFWTSKHIDTRIRTWPLLWGKREVMWLNLDGAKIDLAWDKNRKRNTWTFETGGKGGKPFELPHVERLAAVGTKVDYRDPVMRLIVHIDVDTIRGRDTRLSDTIGFDGRGTLRDKPFRLAGSLLSPNEAVGGGQNKLRLRAWSSDTTVTVAGTLPGATVIDGANLSTTARGDNIQHLFDFIGVVTPATRAYTLRAQMVKDGSTYRFTRLAGRFGQSDLAGRVTVSIPDGRVKIDASLATRTLNYVDASLFVGYDAARVQRTGTVVQNVGGTPRVLPDAPLAAEALKAFDADVRYRVTSLSGTTLPISNIDLTLDLERSLLKLSPLNFTLSGGRVNSNIAINARVPGVFTTYDIRLAPTGMGKLLGRFGVEEAGTTGTISARINLTGTGDSIRRSLATSNGRMAFIIPQGTFWTRNVQLAEIDVGTYVTKLLGKKLKKPVDINCGLIGFTVRGGVAAADPILIDTQKNVILGRGGFSFRNEALDFAFRADGKTFSLFSGQSPIGVGGYFAQPSFKIISPQLVGRAGVGLGLAVFASPLAGVLAFVDVGDAKSAACGPVLAGATAKAQRTTKGQPRDDVGHGRTGKSESGKRSKEERKDQRKKFLGIF